MTSKVSQLLGAVPITAKDIVANSTMLNVTKGTPGQLRWGRGEGCKFVNGTAAQWDSVAFKSGGDSYRCVN